MKKKTLALVITIGLLLFLFSTYSLFFRKKKAGFIPGVSDTIVKVQNSQQISSIIMDFSNCSRGSDNVSFGMGSTEFVFEGIKENSCIFYYGTEIENPNWDRTLSFKCTVPSDLGKRTYTVGYLGISMRELDAYCVRL